MIMIHLFSHLPTAYLFYTHLYCMCHHATLKSSDGLPVCKLVLLSISHGKMSNKNVQLVSKHCCKTS